MTCLLDGHPATTLPVDDRALQYGDGLFETLRVRGGEPEYWEAHWRRLQRGCQALGIPEPARSDLERDVAVLFPDNGNSILKILYSRGSGGRGYTVPETVHPRRLLCRHPGRALPVEPARVRLCSTTLAHQPRLAGLKHLNRLEQVLARGEWDDPAIHEGLLCDGEGLLVEATQANLFWVRNGVLETPDLSVSGVAGIMRERVLELAARDGIPVDIVRQPAAILDQASEVFLCNSIVHLWPVAHWDARRWPAPGPVTARFMASLERDRQ